MLVVFYQLYKFYLFVSNKISVKLVPQDGRNDGKRNDRF